MVLVKRRTRSRFGASSGQGSLYTSQVPYGGDERNSPTSPVNSQSFSFDYYSSSNWGEEKSSKWLLGLLYGLVVFSWIGAYWFVQQSKSISIDLEEQQLALQLQGEQTLDTLKDARQSLTALKKYKGSLTETQEALFHEVRIVNEMFEAEPTGEMPPSPPKESNEAVIAEWLDHRQQTLETKLKSLKEYIQEESRQYVLERWGPGPHRVKFTVNFDKEGLQRDFVMELAPVDLLPHSVHMFLRMVELKLWDNTVFWHHDAVKHVIAGALFSHSTGEPKYHHLEVLGWRGLTFGEYSPAFPHEKYTVGFSGRGPNIYINLMNNDKHHGPGSQDHHELPDEADPCFAKIVENTAIVDAMHRLSIQDEKGEKKHGKHSLDWHENELTHIVKVELL